MTALLAGCSSASDPPPSKHEAKDTASVLEAVPYSLFGVVTLEMSFGFDAGSEEIAPVVLDGLAQPSQIALRFGDETWNGDAGLADSFCTVTWGLDGRRVDDLDASEGWWFGLEGLDESQGTSDCENPKPELNLLAEFSAMSWRFGLGGPLDPDVEALVSPSLSNPEDLVSLFGGLVEVPELLDRGLMPYVQALQLDDSRNVLVNGLDLTEPIDAADILGPNGPATAWYKVGVPWLVTVEIIGEIFE